MSIRKWLCDSVSLSSSLLPPPLFSLSTRGHVYTRAITLAQVYENPELRPAPLVKETLTFWKNVNLKAEIIPGLKPLLPIAIGVCLLHATVAWWQRQSTEQHTIKKDFFNNKNGQLLVIRHKCISHFLAQIQVTRLNLKTSSNGTLSVSHTLENYTFSPFPFVDTVVVIILIHSQLPC